MHMMNQAHNATRYLNTHPGHSLDPQQKKISLSQLAGRMQNIIAQLEAVDKKAIKLDGYINMDYRLTQLREDFQKLAAQCEPADQEVFQLGQIILKFETFFQRINPLECI